MTLLAQQPAAGWGGDAFLVATVCVAALALAAVIICLVLLFRRKDVGQDLREIVVSLEDIRSGRPGRKPNVPDDSELSYLADSIFRLGEDISRRSRESEETAARFRALMEADPSNALVSTDEEGILRSFNPAAEDLFGWKRAEIEGCRFTVLFEEDSWKDLFPKLARREIRDKGLRFQGRLVRKEGTVFDAEMSIRAVRREDGETGGYLASIRDVSERIETRRRLAESEARYRRLVEDLGEGVAILRAGRILYANRAMEDLAGLPVEEMVGEPFRRFVSTGDLLLFKERMDRIESGVVEEDEIRLAFASPAGFRVRLRCAGIEYEGAPAVAVLASDETLDQRVQDDLRRNESRLDAVLEAISFGIVMFADAGEGRALVHLCNQAFLDLFGFRRDQVLGVAEGRLAELMLGEAGGPEERFAGAEGEIGRRALVTDGETEREVEIRVTPLLDRGGDRIGRLLVCLDMSERRRMQEETEIREEGFREEQERLRELNQDLEDARETLVNRIRDLEAEIDDLEEMNQMKSNFLQNVSHDLGTPLVSIRGYTEMIHKNRLGTVNEEQRKALELCLRNIDRLVSMIESLETVSHMEEDLAALEMSDFPLGELIRECVDSMKPRMESRNIGASVRLESETMMVRGDRDKLRHVFDNLINNAIKYNRDGGKIEVNVRLRNPSIAVVQVRDTGVGIPKEDLARIFERAYRVDRADGREIRGSGLGLAIVKHILQLHGCSIQAESELGKGTVFSFTLRTGQVEKRRAERDPGEPETAEPESAEPAATEEPPVPPAGDRRRKTRRRPSPEGKPRLRIIRRS